MVDPLAVEYAGQPAVFIEYDVNASAYDTRENRWWAAHGGSTSGLPLVMVDSGQQFNDGVVTADVYRAIVSTELARAQGGDHGVASAQRKQG